MSGTAAPVVGTTGADHNTGRRASTIVADHGEDVEAAAAAEEAVALAVLDGVTAVVVTTTGPTGVERTRRAIYLTLAGAERAVEAAHVRGHRATAVVVRLVPLGVAR